ncbi:MAG: DUF3300 domain-containing protein [Casimicrobiaceae bacterium]
MIRTLLLLLLASVFLAPLLATAQSPPPGAAAATSPPPAPLPQDKLDALLAPIALYPDQLLGQVLMAATYPLEVVEAARFADQNKELKGDALENALKDKTWDPSVISLASFPQVLAMMNDKLEWTQQLGDAFLANEAQVMQTVQTLRQKAQAAGNLQTTPQQTVVVKENYIYVEPAQTQTVYVPVYNPTVIYGSWWWPNYRPWYWYPPPYYGYGAVVGVGIAFGAGYALGRYNWGWSNPNWRGGNVNINVNNNYYSNRYRNYNQNGNWQHNVDHRKGVAYRDNAVQNRYQNPANRAGAQTREAYRGYDQNRPSSFNPRAGGGQAATRPTTMDRPSQGMQQPSTRQSYDRPIASNNAYNSRESRPQVQQQSQRGAQSRQSMSAPSRSMSGGGAARGGGGGGGRSGGGRR